MILPEIVTKTIDYFESLPGIGPRTAERLTFYLLRTPHSFKNDFAGAIAALGEKVVLCQQCFNISEQELCLICRSGRREPDLLCVVEEPLDLIAVENSGFKGLYHVLGGALSPLNNVGPDDLRIKELVDRVATGNFKEIILATNPSIEGEATAMFVREKIKEQNAKLKITRLGRGLPAGADVEFADSETLSKSLEGRREY
ncbi:MAG: recombination mediator RecR [bacterium]